MATTRSTSLIRFASVVLALAVLESCTRPIATGSLSITFLGVPGGADLDATVTGPAGYTSQVTAATTLTSLQPGTYTVSSTALRVANLTGEGDERFEADPVIVAVATGGPTEAEVAYAYAGLNITDPANDAVSSAPTPPDALYDVVELWTEIIGADLVIHVDLRAGMTNLSDFIGDIFFDVDQNTATGEATTLELFCTDGSAIGAEYYLFVDEPGFVSELLTWPGTAEVALIDRVDTGTRVSFAVPLTAIGGSPRVDVEAVFGHFDEPTDCLRRGAAVWPF